MTDKEYIEQTGLSKRSLYVIDEFFANMPEEVKQYIKVPIKVFGNLTHAVHNKRIITKNGDYIISIVKEEEDIYRIAISTNNRLIYRYSFPRRYQPWPNVEYRPEAMEEIFSTAARKQLDQLGELGGLVDL